MILTQIKSSNIKALGHSAGNLLVQFHTGDTWGYAGVPVETYREMLAAPSVGKYFLANIRSKYHGTKMVTPGMNPPSADINAAIYNGLKKVAAGDDPYAPIPSEPVNTTPLSETVRLLEESNKVLEDMPFTTGHYEIVEVKGAEPVAPSSKQHVRALLADMGIKTE